MDALALVRNATVRFRSNGYEPLDQVGEGDLGQRSNSKPRSEHHRLTTSFSFRRDRAKKRQIFLRSYRLPSVHSSRKSKSRKMKKVVVKFKSVIISVVSIIRFGSLRSCSSPSAVCTSSPMAVQKCC